MVLLLDAAFLLTLAAVVGVLGVGIVGFVRGRPPRRSQTLMRARVALQALAVVLFLAVMWAHS